MLTIKATFHRIFSRACRQCQYSERKPLCTWIGERCVRLRVMAAWIYHSPGLTRWTLSQSRSVVKHDCPSKSTASKSSSLWISREARLKSQASSWCRRRSGSRLWEHSNLKRNSLRLTSTKSRLPPRPASRGNFHLTKRRIKLLSKKCAKLTRSSLRKDKLIRLIKMRLSKRDSL